MMQSLKSFLGQLPGLAELSPQLQSAVDQLVNSLLQSVPADSDSQARVEMEQQLRKLFRTLNTPAKLSILRDPHHRALVVAFLQHNGVEYYKYSYYNRAKLTDRHIQKLKQVGPILFSEAVMIASKLNVINKNSSRMFIEDHLYTQSESPVDIKIQQILKLCDQKKRSVNNNFKKLELILQGEDSIEVVKELGKMLRYSWNKDKSKTKQPIDIVPEPAKKSPHIPTPDALPDLDVPLSPINYDSGREADSYSFCPSQKDIIRQSQLAKQPARNKYELRLYDLDSGTINMQSEYFFDSLQEI